MKTLSFIWKEWRSSLRSKGRMSVALSVYAMSILACDVGWLVITRGGWFHHAILGFTVVVFILFAEMNIALAFWCRRAQQEATEKYLSVLNDTVELQSLRIFAQCCGLAAWHLNPGTRTIQAGPMRLHLEPDGSVTILPPEMTAH